MNKGFLMRALKYAFYITMTCLAVINILFFVCNWYDMQLELNKEGLLLSVVGFFFAFAGINIYSIFNTNIETEKQSLRDLKDQYDNQLKLSEKELRFPKELIKVYQTAQYLDSTDSLTIYSFDWIKTINVTMNDMRNFVREFKECENDYKFEIFRTDLANLSQGVLVLLRHHQSNIAKDAFFKYQIGEKENYTKRLSDLIDFVEETRTFSYEEQTTLTPEDTWWGKVCKVFNYSKKVFGKTN